MATAKAPPEMKSAMKFGVFLRYSTIAPGAQFPPVGNPLYFNSCQHTLQTWPPPYSLSTPASAYAWDDNRLASSTFTEAKRILHLRHLDPERDDHEKSPVDREEQNKCSDNDSERYRDWGRDFHMVSPAGRPTGPFRFENRLSVAPVRSIERG